MLSIIHEFSWESVFVKKTFYFNKSIFQNNLYFFERIPIPVAKNVNDFKFLHISLIKRIVTFY